MVVGIVMNTLYTAIQSTKDCETDKREGLRDYMAIGFKCEAICPDCLNGRLSVRWDSHTLSLSQSDVVRNEQKNVFFFVVFCLVLECIYIAKNVINTRWGVVGW